MAGDYEVRGKNMTWALIATVIGLGAVLAYMFTPSGDDDWGEPGDELAERGRARPRGGGGGGRGGAPSIGPDGVEPPPPPAPAYDPERLADLLVDGGGAPVRAEAVYPAEATAAPDVVGAADPGSPAAPSEEAPSALPERIGPTTPERALRRALFFRDLLDQRLAEMRRRAEAAREAGDDALAERFERQAGRLERERPGLRERIEALERDVPGGLDR